jgi:hypothetical protein
MGGETTRVYDRTNLRVVTQPLLIVGSRRHIVQAAEHDPPALGLTKPWSDGDPMSGLIHAVYIVRFVCSRARPSTST